LDKLNDLSNPSQEKKQKHGGKLAPNRIEIFNTPTSNVGDKQQVLLPVPNSTIITSPITTAIKNNTINNTNNSVIISGSSQIENNNTFKPKTGYSSDEDDDDEVKDYLDTKDDSN
jgi:hypothetical protein